MFSALSSHGQWLVGDLIGLVLVGFEGQGGHSVPVLALNDRSEAAAPVCGVGHGQVLDVSATHRANESHHLKTAGGRNYTMGIIYIYIYTDIYIYTQVEPFTEKLHARPKFSQNPISGIRFM